MGLKGKVEQGGGDFLTMEDLEETIYIGRLESIEEFTGDKSKEFGPGFRLVWELYEGNEELGPVSEINSQRLTPKSNIYARYKALMREEPEVGAEIDLEDMIGRYAKLVIKENPSRKGWPKITEVAPVKDSEIPSLEEKEEEETEEEEEPEEEEDEEAEMPSPEEINEWGLGQCKEFMTELEIPWSGGTVSMARNRIKHYLGYEEEPQVKVSKGKTPAKKSSVASRVLKGRKK